MKKGDLVTIDNHLGDNNSFGIVLNIQDALWDGAGSIFTIWLINNSEITFISKFQGKVIS